MSYFDIFDAFTPLPNYRHKPSVYVISDSEMKAYRERQQRAEVLELRKLVDYHKTQSERLEEEINRIEQELLPPSKDWRYRRLPAPFSLYVLYKYWIDQRTNQSRTASAVSFYSSRSREDA